MLVTDRALPFISGIALQNYSHAEKGIVDAYNHGYQYWYIDASLRSECPSQWSAARMKNMLEMIEHYKVKPILHGNFKIPLASDVDEIRRAAIEYTKKEIDLAFKLNAPLIIHGGAVVEPRQVKAIKKLALANYVDSLLELQDFSSRNGVHIYLENLSNYENYNPFHYIFTQDHEFEYVLSRTELPMFLDIGHANICNGDPAKIISKYSNRIVGMSFSNNDGMRDSHLELSNGTIDFKEIIKIIIKTKWQGIVSFEVRGCSPGKSLQDLNRLYHSIEETANGID